MSRERDYNFYEQHTYKIDDIIKVDSSDNLYITTLAFNVKNQATNKLKLILSKDHLSRFIHSLLNLPLSSGYRKMMKNILFNYKTERRAM